MNYNDEQILELIKSEYSDKKIMLLSPLIKSRKGHYRELFDSLSRQGFLRVRIDGVLKDLKPGMKLDRYKTHDIELVIDRIQVKDNETDRNRLSESIKTAMHYGEDSLLLIDMETEKFRYLSRNLMCPTSGISYSMPEPNSFSFNSPKGMCKNCRGIGKQHVINPKRSFQTKIFRSIREELFLWEKRKAIGDLSKWKSSQNDMIFYFLILSIKFLKKL